MEERREKKATECEEEIFKRNKKTVRSLGKGGRG